MEKLIENILKRDKTKKLRARLRIIGCSLLVVSLFFRYTVDSKEWRWGILGGLLMLLSATSAALVTRFVDEDVHTKAKDWIFVYLAIVLLWISFGM